MKPKKSNLPKMHWLDDFPPEIRIWTRMADSLGLLVTPEMLDGVRCVYWRGPAALFRRLDLFPSYFDFEAVKKARYVHPAGLRGHLIRVGPDEFAFRVEWCLISKYALAKARIAKQDNDFQRFMGLLLAA